MKAITFSADDWTRVLRLIRRGILAAVAAGLWSGCGARMEETAGSAVPPGGQGQVFYDVSPESAAPVKPSMAEPSEPATSAADWGKASAAGGAGGPPTGMPPAAAGEGLSGSPVPRGVPPPPAAAAPAPAPGAGVAGIGGGGGGAAASMPAVESPLGGTPPAPPPEESSKDFHTVEVFYATDRQPASDGGINSTYGKERNRQGPMEYGRTEVSIPKHHRLGIIERPKWYKLEFSEDPKKHVVILKLEKLAADPFFGKVGETASGRPLKEALLFVHGFNVPFDQSVRRTAQISFDLDFGGVALTYSWPSQGVLTGYTVDEDNARWSVPHLARFLVDLQQKSHLDKIHVIAHSMGARLLSEALLNARNEGFELELNNVILAAPDIDADVFKTQILPKIRGSAGRLTMYASSGDTALKASQELHGNDRLGLSGENIVVLEGMDTVDASQIDTSMLGHTYYGSHKIVMEDILELIIQGLEPPQRKLVPGRVGEWDFKALLQ